MVYHIELNLTINSVLTTGHRCRSVEVWQDVRQTWIRTKQLFNISCSLGTKYHYLRHCVEYSRIWSLPIGYNSEQSIENYHKTCFMVFRKYRNQRGIVKSQICNESNNVNNESVISELIVCI